MKRNWLFLLLAFAGALCAFAPAAAAGSLWVDGDSMFSDSKARRLGDLLTVIIVERSAASQEAATRTSQNGEISFGPGLGVLSDVLPLIGAGGEDSSSAGGSTTRGGSLEAKMTTRVVEVLENGLLRIEGRQTIVINNETQEIILSGFVRPRDITPQNTVLSTYVADARITFVGTGALGAKQRPGILTRLLDWLL